MKTASLLVLLCGIVTATAYTPKPGGDSYTIYLNDKMLVEHFVHMKKSLPHLQLGQGKETDRVVVYYSHCGKQGTNRVITVRNDNNEVLKTYRFPDGTKVMSGMKFALKDLNSLQKNIKENLFIYYAAKEMPEAMKLASVNVAETNIARK